jgi:hypothetical protein
MKPNILVFDVESTSLHGIGFAVGAVVLDRNGEEIDRFELLSKEGAGLVNDWVTENVIPHLQDMPTCFDLTELRTKFYEFYIKHKEDSEIWSDCNFPVETNFLSAIVNDNPEERQWNMPYPLKDISTIVDIEIDRTETYKEECSISLSDVKLRKHNPLDDSIASAYHLIKAIKSGKV